MIQTEKVEKFFDSIKDNEIASYNEYWAELKPQTTSGIFRRYLFAFMSVHTSWEMNCKGYNAIKQYRAWVLSQGDQIEFWNYNADKLFKKIQNSRVGMQNNRTRYIGQFAEKFWDNPSEYTNKQDDECWTDWRNRLQKNILGLGKAKTSFAIEMLFPTQAQVACMDTHLFQVYGLDQSKNTRLYFDIEKDWVDRSEKRGLAPYMARCIYWDRNQNRKNSRYWSKVLEK